MEAELRFAISAIDGPVILPPANPRRIIRGLAWDSREVTKDGMFLAMPGEKADGNDYVRQAVRAGANIVVATRVPDDQTLAIAGEFDCAVIQVDDPLRAMRELAAAYRDSLSASVVGITGSTGKTTTKDIVASVLSQGMSTVATRANQNNELGVPATVLAANKQTQALIVEMGMRGLGQIEDLCSFVKPHIGLVTNVGVSHIELLGSRENIAKAKGELLAALPSAGTAIVNGDDPMTPVMLEAASPDPGVRIVRFGLSEGCDVTATDVVFSEEGYPTFELVLPDGATRHVSLRLPGAHNVSNALSAAAVGYVLDMTPAAIAEGLILAQPTAQRFQTAHAACGALIIDDAYNANPDSMRAALSTLQHMDVAGRRIAVLGDMGELGEEAPSFHRSVGVCAARSDLDLLVCVGTLAADIATAAAEAGMPEESVLLYPDKGSAIEFLSPLLDSGDVVLVKASHAMRFDLIVKGLVG